MAKQVWQGEKQKKVRDMGIGQGRDRKIPIHLSLSSPVKCLLVEMLVFQVLQGPLIIAERGMVVTLGREWFWPGRKWGRSPTPLAPITE